MVSATPTVEPHAAAALHAALRARGFELEDFRLDIDRSTTQALGVPGGLIQVRCLSTGEERLYPFGSGSAWLGAFLMDLGGGHFGRAARKRLEPMPSAARRSLLQRLGDAGRVWARALHGSPAMRLTAPPLTAPP